MSSAERLSAEHLQSIDELVTHTAMEHSIPSTAIGLVVDGALIHTCNAGDITPSSRTVFRIASMTKSFTAAATLLLRDEGALRLDDPIATHVPELAGLRLPTTDSPDVTLRSLLSMASGLATDDAWADRHLDDSPLQMDALFRAGGTFGAAPGVTMTYSNYGYAMLGRAVSAAAGVPFETFITDRLIRPLGMEHTVWSTEALPGGADIAAPFRLQDDRLVADTPAPLGHGGVAAMGGLWSCVEDVARWMSFLADAFPPRNAEESGPLSRASRREMQQAHRSYRAPTQHVDADGELLQIGLGYGFGLQVMHHLTLGPVIAHSGGLPGYGSNMRWLPDHGFGVVGLANRTYAPMFRLTQQILDLLAGADTFASPEVAVSDVLRAQSAALVELLSAWDDATAATIFADNVALDDGWERRSADAARLRDHCGDGIEIAHITAIDACQGDVAVRGESGSATIEVQLAPTVPSRVQWYEVTLS